MKKILKLSFLLLSISINAQVYTDNFNESIVSTDSPPTGFTIAISNQNLQINSDGNGGAWSAIQYNMHTSGTSTTIDTSSSPKLFIKAKASNPVTFRIDLRDETGYVTNQNSTSVNLTTDYEIYEFDYTSKLFDGGYGGPCAAVDAPCPVDATKIGGLSIFTNPGTGMYTGIIDIEWIALGASPVSIPDHSVRLNQVGYFTDQNKIISVNSSFDFSGLNYTITNSSNTIVKTGITPSTSFWSDAEEYVAHLDISDITTEGTYTIDVDGVSKTFNIGDDIYSDLADAVFKYYYFNRASTEITSTYGGDWARATGLPDTSVKIHSSAATSQRPEGTIISAPKGWYDAGDYNKYIVNSGISTYTLLAAFEAYESYYQSKEFNIPESGDNLPDILDEVIWNLDWMLAMQDPNDGGVYHKLTGLSFSGIIMPDAYTFDRYVVQKSTSAALNFAAVMAIASRVFSDYETEKPGFSAQLLTAAKSAYSWAETNPTDYFTNPSGVVTGEYGDTDVSDEFQWAATELFITTKETQYKNDITVSAIPSGVSSWQQVGSLALFSINKHSDDIASDIDITTAKTRLLTIANQLKSLVNSSEMKIAMTTSDYVWGSNGVAGNQVVYLIKAYEITDDESYLDAAYTAMDYLLGRNGVNTSFISGYGSKAMLYPHHRISEADEVVAPVPGMVAGGPQPGQQDGCSYTSALPAKSYVDDWCSYASNEVTINWNAPLVYAVNALQYYQDQNTTLSTFENEATADDDVIVYPNPSSEIIHIEGLTSQIHKVTITNLKGKRILSSSKVSEINIKNLSAGTYLVKIKTENGTITKRFIKK